MKKPVLFLAAAVAAALLFSGCAGTAGGSAGPGATPVATPTVSPPARATPSRTATASASLISIGSLSVSTVDAAGATIATAPYTGGAKAMVAFLSAAIGTSPTTTRQDGTDCAGPGTTYTWARGFVVDVPDTQTPPLYTWTVQARSAQVGDTGVSVQSSTGLVVGTDVSASVAALPADQKIDEYNDGTGPLVFEVAGRTTEGKPYGGAALAGPGGVLAAIAAPAGLGAFYC